MTYVIRMKYNLFHLPKVLDHDWSSKLYDLNDDFSRHGQAHMIAGHLSIEPFEVGPRKGF